MKLTDIISKEEWIEFALEIQKEYGLQTSVLDAEHTGFHAPPFTNDVCTTIRKNKKTAGRVCSLAQQDIANEAKVLKQPVVEECDAGLVKIVVPVFHEDGYIGSITLCGAIEEGSEAEIFHISRLLETDEKEVEEMYRTVRVFTADELDGIAEEINKRLQKQQSK